jgi:hypothetical protein
VHRTLEVTMLVKLTVSVGSFVIERNAPAIAEKLQCYFVISNFSYFSGLAVYSS